MKTCQWCLTPTDQPIYQWGIPFCSDSCLDCFNERNDTQSHREEQLDWERHSRSESN